MTSTCPQGHPIEPGDSFCGVCGTPTEGRVGAALSARTERITISFESDDLDRSRKAESPDGMSSRDLPDVFDVPLGPDADLSHLADGAEQDEPDMPAEEIGWDRPQRSSERTRQRSQLVVTGVLSAFAGLLTGIAIADGDQSERATAVDAVAGTETTPATASITETSPFVETTAEAPVSASEYVFELGYTDTSSPSARELIEAAGPVSDADPRAWIGADLFRIAGAELVYLARERSLDDSVPSSVESMWVVDEGDVEGLSERLAAELESFGDVVISPAAFQPFSVELRAGFVTASVGAISDEAVVVWFQTTVDAATISTEMPGAVDEIDGARQMIDAANSSSASLRLFVESGVGPLTWRVGGFAPGATGGSVIAVPSAGESNTLDWAMRLCDASGGLKLALDDDLALACGGDLARDVKWTFEETADSMLGRGSFGRRRADDPIPGTTTTSP